MIINILKYGNMRDAREIVKKIKTCGPGRGVGKPLLPARLDLPKKTIFGPAKIKSGKNEKNGRKRRAEGAERRRRRRERGEGEVQRPRGVGKRRGGVNAASRCFNNNVVRPVGEPCTQQPTGLHAAEAPNALGSGAAAGWLS